MEKDIIRQLHEGNSDAFDSIYAIYAPRLLAYCRRQVGCEEEAEDLVQEVFVALWRNRENVRNEVTLPIYGIAQQDNQSLESPPQFQGLLRLCGVHERAAGDVGDLADRVFRI